MRAFVAQIVPIVLVACVGCGTAPTQTPFPEEIAKPWREAGAQVGWSGLDGSDLLGFHLEANGLRETIPAFRVGEWRPGLLRSLPRPTVPFGLYLQETNLHDADLAEIAEVPNIQRLNLSGTKVTDAGLKELSRMKSLRSLGLGAVPISDAGAKELSALKELTTLNLCETAITDAGLREFHGSSALRTLLLVQTPVSDAGIDEFRRACPKCRIVR